MPMGRPVRQLYLVASLTTSPTRIGELKPTLDSLRPSRQLRSFDAVLLTLPRIFARTGQGYPEPLPPAALAPHVTVLRCEDDWGPATKLVPAVRHLSVVRIDAIVAALGLPAGSHQQALERTHIVLVDDDTIYPAGMALSLARTAIPTRSECAGGWTIVPRTAAAHEGIKRQAQHLGRVHVCEGYSGWRVPLAPLGGGRLRAFEARMRELSADPDIRLSDDLLVSDYLARSGVGLAHHSTLHFHLLLVQQRQQLNRRADALHAINTSGATHWARYARVVHGGKLDALPDPERWDELCRAQRPPGAPPPRAGERACACGADGARGGSRGGRAGRHKAAGNDTAAVAAEALSHAGTLVLGDEHSGARTLAELIDANLGCAGRPDAAARAAARRAQRDWVRLGGAGAGADAVRASLRLLRAEMRRPVVLVVREVLRWLKALHATASHDATLSMSRRIRAAFVSESWQPARAWLAGGGCGGNRSSDAAAAPSSAAGGGRRLRASHTPRTSACAEPTSVQPFESAVAMRTARLRLVNEAFGLRGTAEGATPGGAADPVHIVRYEDFADTPAAVACQLGGALGLCARRAHARLAVGGAPGPERELLDGGVLRMRMQLMDVSTAPCTAATSFTADALDAVFAAVDWKLERRIGYHGESTYRQCATRGGQPSQLEQLRAAFHPFLKMAMPTESLN